MFEYPRLAPLAGLAHIGVPSVFGLTHPRWETGGVFLGTYEMVCCRTSIREERVVKFTCIQMSWSSKAFAS
jgi:hypothetical protein